MRKSEKDCFEPGELPRARSNIPRTETKRVSSTVEFFIELRLKQFSKMVQKRSKENSSTIKISLKRSKQISSTVEKPRARSKQISSTIETNLEHVW